MKKLNNRGFTLVEVLAVIVILGVLAAIMIPNVSKIISENKNDNYNNLKKSIMHSAELFISDNRYDITLDGSCENDDSVRNIVKIGESGNNGKILLRMLFIDGYLSSENIINPLDSSKKVDLNNSYVKVVFSCKKRDYEFYEFDDCGNGKSCLKWTNK